MASSPITSWQVNGEKLETVTDYFLGLQNHCGWWRSHEIKRLLLLRRKAMTNLESTFKSRNITLPMKVYTIKAMVFLPVMYGCECWTIKNADYWRTDAFECGAGEDIWEILHALRYFLAKRSNQSILKEINPEYSLKIISLNFLDA